jgi:YYY domain-containing protein
MGFFDLIVWLLVLELMSFAVLPYLAWMAPNAPDKGYAFSKVCGLFVFGLLCWLPVTLGLLEATPTMTMVVFAGVLLLGHRGYLSKRISLGDVWQVVREHAFAVEGLFLGLTLFFAVVRFLNPEIVWGEKPMDSTFLNFFVRNTTLPPQDPWAAGSTMTYYYVGIYFIAAVLKLTGIPVSIGYNLAIATLAGLIGASLYGVLALLSRRMWYAFTAAALLVVASDPEVLRICFVEGKIASFDNSFWASTRVFTSPGFLEYTGWSLLFADLHAHVIAIPFTIAALGLATVMFLSSDYRYSSGGVALRVSLGLLVGILMGMNTWDFLTFGGVVGLMTLTAPAPSFWRPPSRPDGSVSWGERAFAAGFARLVALPWDGAWVVLGMLLAALPYQFSTPIDDRAGWGWVTTTEFNTLGQFLRVLGFQVLALGCALGVGVVEAARRRKLPGLGSLLFVVLGGVVILVPPTLSVLRDNSNIPWAVFSLCAGLLLVSSFVWWGDRTSPEKRVIHVFVSSAAMLIVVLEVFYLMDRMNTLFKGYMAVWSLSAIGAAAGLYYAWTFACRNFRRLLLPLVGTVIAVLALSSFVGGMLNVKAVVMMKRVPVRYFTLDGAAYLRDVDRDDYELIKWLNGTVSGTPTILEAQGDSYRHYTRIAMHTGIPTVLGWEYHVLQRGLPHEELIERKAAVREIYTGYDMDTTRDLLQRLHVDLIVVSGVERELYAAGDVEKFDRHPELFIPVVSFGQARLYVSAFSPYRSIFEGKNS